MAEAKAAGVRSEVVAKRLNTLATVTGADWFQRQYAAYASRIAAAETATKASLRAVLADVRAVKSKRITDPAQVARIQAQAATLRRMPYRQVVAHLLDKDEARDLAAVQIAAVVALVGGVVVYLSITETIRSICAAKQVSDVSKANADTAARAIAVQQAALAALPRDARGQLTPEGSQAAEVIAGNVRDIQAASAASTASATASAQGGIRLVPALVVLGVVGAAWWWWKQKSAATSKPTVIFSGQRRLSFN